MSSIMGQNEPEHPELFAFEFGKITGSLFTVLSSTNTKNLLRTISPFPTVFSKGLFPRGVKRCHCVGICLANQKLCYINIHKI